MEVDLALTILQSELFIFFVILDSDSKLGLAYDLSYYSDSELSYLTEDSLTKILFLCT